MDIYNYDDAGIYVGTSQARPNPMEEGEYLLPAKATFTPVPALGANETAVYDGTWSVVADYRGVHYWLDGDEFVINNIGVIPPADSTDTPPIVIPPTEEEIEDRVDWEDAPRQLARATFVQENRIRALEGKGPITWRTFVKVVRAL